MFIGKSMVHALVFLASHRCGLVTLGFGSGMQMMVHLIYGKRVMVTTSKASCIRAVGREAC